MVGKLLWLHLGLCDDEFGARMSGPEVKAACQRIGHQAVAVADGLDAKRIGCAAAPDRTLDDVNREPDRSENFALEEPGSIDFG